MSKKIALGYDEKGFHVAIADFVDELPTNARVLSTHEDIEGAVLEAKRQSMTLGIPLGFEERGE